MTAEGSPISDHSLMRRAAAGDASAFDEIVRRHQAAVYRFARAVSGSREAAEDLLQETFLAAWKAAATYRAEASLRTWLLTIARHAAWRDRGRPFLEPLDGQTFDMLGMEAGWGQVDPEGLAVSAERRARLRAALERLDPEDRTVIVLRDLEELTGEETAAVLGIGVAAMKSRLHRARLRLAAELRREGRHAAAGS
jgi:RNA polymerase sigma-70 factor (ECF subfamily)